MSESIAPPAPPAATGAPTPAAPAVADRSPLKIGIVSPYGYPHPGGVNEHVRHAYEAMRRMGHDVWIINFREQDRPRSPVSRPMDVFAAST